MIVYKENGLTELVLYHPGTKEERSVPIEAVHRTFITVRWGMAGLYDIFTRDNVMVARNPKSRRRHIYCLWKAVDIESVKNLINDYFGKNAKQLEFEASFKEHLENMPKARAKRLSESSEKE